jgi:tape measure domain-containing protein
VDLPDLIQRLICDISGWTMPMQQASSAADGLLAIMSRMGQTFGQVASQSNTTTGAINQQTQAMNNAATAAARMVQAFGSGGTLAAPGVRSPMGDAAKESGTQAATFARNWINAAGQAKAAIGGVGDAVTNASKQFRRFLEQGERRGATDVQLGMIPSVRQARLEKLLDEQTARDNAALGMRTRDLTAAGVLGGPSVAADRAANEALQRSIQRQLRAQAQAARGAAHATEQAFTRIRMSWVQFGRDMMSLADRIANSLATTISHTVPFFGPILGGAIRGAGMGGNIGGGLGGAVGGSVGMFAGGPAGMLAGQVIGTGVGYGVGSLVGAGIGGQAAALVQGITLAVNALEKAFDAAAGAAKNVVASVVSLASEFQRVGTAFEVFTGSASKGNQLFAEMQQLAVQTPYNLRQMVDISQTLLAMGVPFEDVTNSMRMLGDVAAGDVDRLRRLTLAFSEVVAEGKLTGQRMRQFAAAGVGVADIAQTMGIPVPQLREMMREGAVPAQAVIDTLERITSAGGRFFQMSERQAKTVAGAWSNLIDKLEILGAKLGQAVFQRFDVSGMIGRVGDFVGENAPAVLEKLIGLLKAVQAAFTGLFQAAVPYWKQLILAVEEFIGTIDLTPTGLDNVRQAFVKMGDTILQTLGQVTRLILNLATLAIPFMIDSLNSLKLLDSLKSTAETPLEFSEISNLGPGNEAIRKAERERLERESKRNTVINQITDSLKSLAGQAEMAATKLDTVIEKGLAAGTAGAQAQVGAFGQMGAGGIGAFGRLTGGLTGTAMVPVLQGVVNEAVGQVAVPLLRKGFALAAAAPANAFDQEALGAWAWAARNAPGVPGTVTRPQAFGVGSTLAPKIPDKKDLTITVSEEAQKLVDDLRKNMLEGLTPLEQLENKFRLIREGAPFALSPEELLKMQAVEADKILQPYMQAAPSPNAVMIGTKEAGDVIADAQNQGTKSIEAALEEANGHHRDIKDRLGRVAEELGKRQKEGRPLVAGDFGGG